jgi:hypothetical protein
VPLVDTVGVEAGADVGFDIYTEKSSGGTAANAWGRAPTGGWGRVAHWDCRSGRLSWFFG